VRLDAGAEAHKLRGRKQRAIMQKLAEAGAEGNLRLDEIEAEIPGATVALRAMAQRGIVEIVAAGVDEYAPAPYLRTVGDETTNDCHAKSNIDQRNAPDTRAAKPFELSWEQSAPREPQERFPQ